MNNEPLLTEREFCLMFSMSRVSAWRLRKQGKISYLKLPQGIRYTKAHIQNFIASRECNPQRGIATA